MVCIGGFFGCFGGGFVVMVVVACGVGGCGCEFVMMVSLYGLVCCYRWYVSMYTQVIITIVVGLFVVGFVCVGLFSGLFCVLLCFLLLFVPF